MQLSKHLFFYFLLMVFMLGGCSTSDEKDDPTTTKLSTEKIAQDAINSIKTPIENAKIARQQIEEQNKRTEEALKQ